jgi:serine/threonine-protein kinase
VNHLINRVGRYKIRKRLRRGGMSDVYLAFDTKKKKPVALKLIEQRDDRDTRDAIKAEGDGVKLQQALSAYEPTVPKVEDFGTLGDFFYIAMEYVEGTDLSEMIERRQLTTADVIRIGASVCRTLQIAHTLTTTIDGREITQIVHGDIKPKNIRLTKDGTIKLLDFGIAKALSLLRGR